MSKPAPTLPVSTMPLSSQRDATSEELAAAVEQWRAGLTERQRQAISELYANALRDAQAREAASRQEEGDPEAP